MVQVKTPVDLYAMMISTVTPKPLTNAWIVSMAVMNALMVPPVTPVMMITFWSSLTTPVFLYAMMISTVTPKPLTVAWIV
jgi:hypothetical protein